MTVHRSKVLKLYKTLLFMGREYPLGYSYFRERCHRAFLRNSGEQDAEKVLQLIKHGEYVVKELTALYALKKYRTLKRRYYPEDDAETAAFIEKFKSIPTQPPTPS